MKKTRAFFSFFKKNKILLSFIGGLLFSVPFIVPELFILSVLGIALVFISVYPEEKFGKMFLKGFLCGIGFYIPLYHWFIALYPFEGFSITPAQGVFIIIAACIGISSYHALFMGASFFLLGKINTKKELLPLGIAVAWMFDEWIISLGVLGFSWGRTAISQAFFLPMIQTTSLFGIYFTTFIVVICGAYLGYAIISKERKTLFAISAASIYFANIIVGTILYFIPQKFENEFTASIIQGNIASDDKWENNGQSSVDYYLTKLEEIAKKGESDLIVLPESCFPVYINDKHYIMKNIQRISSENNVAVAFGCIYYNEGAYNSLYLIDEFGELKGYYSKIHLVPFGEFLPFEDILGGIEFIQNINLGGMHYIKGTEATILEAVGSTKFGSLVCFDSIFPDLARSSVRNGAQIINVVTNDSWYKDTSGVYQHATYSRILAIQNGRYVVRSANTGVSMIIDNKGNIIDQIPPLVPGDISASVKTSNHVTLYNIIGDAFFPVVMIIYFVLCLVYYLKQRYFFSESNNEKVIA